MRRFILLVVALGCLSFVPPPAVAGEAAALLQDRVDQVLATLEDRGRDAAERRRRVREVVDTTFDFEEASRRLLGRVWQDRTSEERQRFVRLFVDLVDRAYLRRLDQWDGERIVVLDDTVDGDRATVQTAIVAQDNGRTPVSYLMHRAPDGWRVVDVNIAGMSLLANYRAQFARLLQAGGFPHLMERLEAKVASLQP